MTHFIELIFYFNKNNESQKKIEDIKKLIGKDYIHIF